METFTKFSLVFLFLCLGTTTTILAITPAGNQYLYISNTTCVFDDDCTYCANITLNNGTSGGSSNGYGNANGYGSSNGYGNSNSYGYGYTNTGNYPAPAPATNISGMCTPLGRFEDMCIFCLLDSAFDPECPLGYCACGASAFNSEDCSEPVCLLEYKLDVSQFGSCVM